MFSSLLSNWVRGRVRALALQSLFASERRAPARFARVLILLKASHLSYCSDGQASFQASIQASFKLALKLREREHPRVGIAKWHYVSLG